MILQTYNQKIFLCCDDIGVKYHKDLIKLNRLKEKYNNFKVNCFVIAKDLDNSLQNWLNQDWIEVGVHGYEHDYPPEMERVIEERKNRLEQSLEILKPLLKSNYYFRFPGWQATATSYELLKNLGFYAIIHQNKIQFLKEKKSINILLFNCHIYDDLEFNFEESQNFGFISELFNFNNNAC